MYLIRLFVLMTIYIITLFAAVTAFKSHAVSGISAYALAVLPALPIIGVFWAVMRLLVEEPDEFIRMLHVRQCLVATGFCLTVMTIWEFLQNFDLMPHQNFGFGAAFFWFMGLGVGALYNRMTLGTDTGCA
jgi:ABC-type anion transport system duplicated permease subunit